VAVAPGVMARRVAQSVGRAAARMYSEDLIELRQCARVIEGANEMRPAGCAVTGRKGDTQVNSSPE
jgi:hypothetical protein